MVLFGYLKEINTFIWYLLLEFWNSWKVLKHYG